MISRMKKVPVIDKIIVCTLIVLVIIFTIILHVYNVNQKSNQVKTDYFEGYGTLKSPYLISTADDIARLSTLVNSGNSYSGKYFQLTNDIDMNGTLINPIGIYEGDCFFYGVFDGNGYSLSNVYISTGGYDGLFGALGGTVMNLGIASGFIGNLNNERYCGAIACSAASDNARIINCYNRATVGGYRAGGIADSFDGYIVNCWSDCELYGIETGGITSDYLSAGSQSFCYSTFDLTGDGTGERYECGKLTDIELYTNKMARLLSSNCAIWSETMIPIKQLNKWTFTDGELSLTNKKMSAWDIRNYIWAIAYHFKHNIRFVIMSIFIVASIVLTLVKYIKRTGTIEAC